MRVITLVDVSLDKFRSFSSPATIPMAGTPGLRLITGNNLAEPRLGANGVGKSTLFDAICFALYGTSIKGLRASDLVSHGGSKCEVSVTLQVDNALHVVRRTAPPSRLYLDGEVAEQGEVDRLVGLSRSRFLNSVVFGQAVPLFLDLPVPARGDLLDEVLGLEVWMEAAQLAGTRHSAKVADLNVTRRDKARVQGQIEGLPDLAALKAQERDWSRQHADKVCEIRQFYDALVAEHAKMLKQKPGEIEAVADTSLQKKAADDLQTVVTDLRVKMGSVKSEVGRLSEEVEFLTENDTCPTCGQEIDDAAEHVTHAQEKIKELEAESSRLMAQVKRHDGRLSAARDIWQKAVRVATETATEHRLLASRIRDKAAEVDRVHRVLSQSIGESNPYTEQRVGVAERRRELRAKLSEIDASEAALLAEMTGLEYWRGGFRKVRLFCLERVLAELTVETRNVLAALGLVDWRIEFSTSTETKSGTTKLGVQAEVRSPESGSKLEMLSGGESQRARLAVSLGLANLIQRWSGVRWTTEIFDEPTAFLSHEGIEDLLEALGTGL